MSNTAIATNSHEPTAKKQKLELDDSNNENNNLILNELLYQRSQITHLDYNDRILLLGEGDFSFAASLSHLGFCNVVATSYNDYNSIIHKYHNSKCNIQLIKRMRNVIFHNIDINEMHKSNYFKSFRTEKLKFDVIIFNFPHSGVPNYEYKKSIPSNQQLLCSIFEQSSNLLKNNGELHIALKGEPIYNSWDIQKQCKIVNNGFALKRRILFEQELFFGYRHTTTNTVNNKNVFAHKSFVWIFAKFVDGITRDWTPIESEAGIKFSVGMYKCKTCHKIFNSEKRYEMHMNSKKHHENKKNNKIKEKRKQKSKY